LNAICYALADVKSYHDELKDFDFWKRTAKHAAEIEAAVGMSMPPDWHNAGYDAVTSLLAWNWLHKIVGHPAPSSTRFTTSRSEQREFVPVIDPPAPTLPLQ